MKFIILSILGVFAFRTSGVSADCCQTSGECPEVELGTFRAASCDCLALGLTTNGSNKVCKVGGTTSSCTLDSSMAICSGGDVPTPTSSTPAPPTPAPPASTCCQTSGECPEGYKSIGSFDNNIYNMGLTINGSNKVCNFNYGSCTAIDSSMAICSGNDLLSTPTPPTPSSAGKIGMGYVWFVAAAAAAAAFAGIN